MLIVTQHSQRTFEIRRATIDVTPHDKISVVYRVIYALSLADSGGFTDILNYLAILLNCCILMLLRDESKLFICVTRIDLLIVVISITKPFKGTNVL